MEKGSRTMSRFACFLMSLLFCHSVFSQELETYVSFDRTVPPGNIAIGPDGRVFISVHEFYGEELRVVEVFPDGMTKPYPSATWARKPLLDGEGLNGVLGLQVDREGILWMLDGHTENSSGRLVAWNTNTETLHAVYYIPAPIAKADSFLNDLAVDRENEAVYIADTGNGENSALVVVDLETGRARRLLEGSKFTLPEDKPMIIDGREMMLGGASARLGINPITIDPSNTWVYFGAMSGTQLYRIRTVDINNGSLSNAELEARVERYGKKPLSDGITVDGGGNVYITSITDDSVGVVQSDGQYKTLYQRDDLSWPDGFAYGPDDKIYFTVNELHRSPVLNGGEDGTLGEFKIMRFDPIDLGVSGR